ncbi:MAG: hypothetical protein PVG66_00655 [Chromatiales bacterium]|jgi:hypothetical protein
MITKRTRYSLAQFLELYEADIVVMLLSKYDIRISITHGQELYDILNCIRGENEDLLLQVLGEIARTTGSLRSKISPKYIYDERFDDLVRCLQLDGYLLANKTLVQLDPSIGDGESIEDDLIRELKGSGLAKSDEIIRKINESSNLFRSVPQNFNACLNDIRVALETLAAAIAETRVTVNRTQCVPTKWGEVINFLRSDGLITVEEERGLAGVYGFISPGSHRPLGITEEQMARLGRSLALGMCWFLVKLFAPNE